MPSGSFSGSCSRTASGMSLNSSSIGLDADGREHLAAVRVGCGGVAAHDLPSDSLYAFTSMSASASDGSLRRTFTIQPSP